MGSNEMNYYGTDVTEMSVRQINKLFREHDESCKWPICGEFNVTERAIRRLRKFTQQYGPVSGFEYAYMLDQEINNIVNHCNQ